MYCSLQAINNSKIKCGGRGKSGPVMCIKVNSHTSYSIIRYLMVLGA